MRQHINLSGQFRIVKKSKDGEVLYDSGTLANLMLDTGLDFFGKKTGNNMLTYLAIGAGNSEPSVSQNRLDNVLQIKSGSEHAQKDDYTEGETYTVSKTYKYSFNELNANISELGLVSGSSTIDYTAYTRALIKDEHGKPLVITVLQDEILEIFYTLKQVYHIQDVVATLSMADGRGGTRGDVDITMRLAGVGNLVNMGGNAKYGRCVGEYLQARTYAHGNNHPVGFNSSELGDVKGMPTGGKIGLNIYGGMVHDYVPRSFKNQVTWQVPHTADAPNLGAMLVYTTMGFYQISFSPKDGGLINKDTTRTFSITLEFSWGRDERE